MRHESMPLDHLYAWAELNQVRLIGTAVETHILAPDGGDKGGGLVVKSSHGPGEALLKVPLDLVLSKERVYEQAKADKQLRELLEVVPPLLQVGSPQTIKYHQRPSLGLSKGRRHVPQGLTCVLYFRLLALQLSCSWSTA